MAESKDEQSKKNIVLRFAKEEVGTDKDALIDNLATLVVDYIEISHDEYGECTGNNWLGNIHREFKRQGLSFRH